MQQEDGDVVDGNVLQYCSIDKKKKKTIGEMEQEFLRALQVRTNSIFLLLLLLIQHINRDIPLLPSDLAPFSVI
jgi:hypothetical protein